MKAFRLIQVGVVSGLLATGLMGCPSKPEPVPDVSVDPAFEMTPPIAAEVVIQRLEDDPNGNLLVVADFGSSLRSPFHAVTLSTGKVVLRDDGRGGDARAGDHKYSVALTEDLERLTEELTAIQKSAAILMREPPPTFRGREMVPADLVSWRKFDLEGFKRGGPILIPPSWICALRLDPSPDHSLMVTHVKVVEDSTRANHPCSPGASADGPWSFGKLMENMANEAATGVSAEDFVKRWLTTWQVAAAVNGDPVPARSIFDFVISPWVVKSGASVGSFDARTWTIKRLDLKFAPFKLTAIVNRLDLRGNGGYGFANPGEGRFVFETVDVNTCAPLENGFTVILEYGIPIHGCTELKAYGEDWYDLKDLTLGSAEYNTALQELTDVFAVANADPSKPNGSALNQIRTNEIVLGSPWELREFNIDPVSHHLVLTTVKQEPAKKYNAMASPPGAAPDVALMADWVNTNEADVIADGHTVPATLPGGPPFLGGKAHTEFGGFWDAAPLEITADDARHHFSLNTCSGCHGGETGTTFLHVGLAPFGGEASLSGFLTGTTIVDPAGRPAGSPTSRTFNDLAMREERLKELLCTRCGSRLFELFTILRFKPVHMPH